MAPEITPCTSLEEALREPDRVRILDLSRQLPDHSRADEFCPIGDDEAYEQNEEEFYYAPGGPVTIHDVLGEFRNLIELDLSGNELETLPEDIGSLRRLRVLNVQDNRLQFLPPEIGNLRRLISLNVQDNELSTLPEEIGFCTRLEEVFLQNNRLKSLPAGFGNLNRLKSLDLTGNRIGYLPPEVGGLANLKQLVLRENELCDLDRKNLKRLVESLSRIVDLAALDLSFNYLKWLPPEIGRLTRLSSLDLSHNELADLPKEVGNLTNLEELLIHRNSPFPGSDEELDGLFRVIDRLSELRLLSIRCHSILPPPSIGRLHADLKLRFEGRYGTDRIAEFRKMAAKWHEEGIPCKVQEMMSASQFSEYQTNIRWLQRTFRKELSPAEQLSLLDVDDPNLAVWAVAELAERLPSPFDKETVLGEMTLLFSGEFRNVGLDHVSEQLKEMGVRVEQTLSGRVTHLVAGMKGSRLAQRAVEMKIRLVFEPQLRDWLYDLDPPYLMMESEESTKMQNNVRSLLLNENPTNVQLGLAMMQTGGVDETLLEVIIGLLLYHSDAETRATARALFQKYAPWGIQAHVGWVGRSPWDDQETLEAKGIENNCHRICSGKGLDVGRMIGAALTITRIEAPALRHKHGLSG